MMPTVLLCRTALMILHSDDIYAFPHWQQPSTMVLPAQLEPWLLCPGSLTQKLTALRPGFRLQLLSESPQPLPPALARRWQTEQGMRRDVVLWLDATPCVYAQSYLPDTTLQALTPLAQLGNTPLGHYIFQQPDLQRRGMEVAQFAAGVNLPSLGPQPALWGRRSFFALQQHELLVQELFLAGLLT